jgi:ABC-2 type transport system ATP-binding protein
MSDAAIETNELKKTYRTLTGKTVAALQGVSLRVEYGTIFGLIGQNGAGKTTLVKILLGLSSPSMGSAELLGGSPSNAAVRRRVGYLPEQMRIPDYMKARGFLKYMGRLNQVGSEELKQRIPELLDLVGLAGVKKPVKAYSKGMQQRLGLAQALLNDPRVLFLDEPTDGLDPVGRKDVRDLIVRLRERGKTIFLNSHLLSEVESVCDRIMILDKGSVARMATPSDFTRGTGEVQIRVTTVSERVRGAVAAVLGPASGISAWHEKTLRFTPADIGELNAVIDALRRLPVEIEAIEPTKLSLESFFLQVIGEGPNS